MKKHYELILYLINKNIKYIMMSGSSTCIQENEIGCSETQQLNGYSLFFLSLLFIRSSYHINIKIITIYH